MRRLVCRFAILLAGLSVWGGCSGPTVLSPTPSRYQVAFTSQAPEHCAGPCLHFSWVDQGSVDQGMLKIAVQVENVSAPGIFHVGTVLSGRVSGTLSERTKSFALELGGRDVNWSAGDFFERLGRPVMYEVEDFGAINSSCCSVDFDVSLPRPAAIDRVSGGGTVIVFSFKLLQPGVSDLIPEFTVFDNATAITVTEYPAQIRVTLP